jgi:hypothetical protein
MSEVGGSDSLSTYRVDRFLAGAPVRRGSRTPTELNGFRVFDGASLAHSTTEASAAAILHPGELATGTPKFDDG